MPIYGVSFLFLLMFFSPNMMAMDEEGEALVELDTSSSSSKKTPKKPKTSAAKSGLSVGEAANFICEQECYSSWDIKNVCCNLGRGAGVSVAFGLVGSIISGLYCQNYQVRDQCQQDCYAKKITPPAGYGCNSYCDGFYGINTPGNPVCITGAAFVTECLAMWAIFACNYPITKAQNYFAGWLNGRIHEKVRQQLKRGRQDQDVLEERDFYWNGLGDKLITTQSPLLQKLSAAQALFMAEKNLHRLLLLPEKCLSDSAFARVDDLRKMLEMDAPELAQTLGRALKVFTKEPILWQVLVRSISDEIRHDEEVRKSLVFLLKAILNDQGEKNWDLVIDQVTQGSALNSYILKEILVDTNSGQDDQVEICCGEEVFLLDKGKMIASSEYFKSRYSGNFDSFSSPSKEDPKKLKIVVDALRGMLQLTPYNVFAILEAATFYQMPETIARCDRFIRDVWANSYNVIIDRWLHDYEGSEEWDAKDFSAHWHFCKTFSLLETKRLLASELILKINNHPDNDMHRELAPLLDDKLEEIMVGDTKDQLGALLARPKLLKWLWENGHTNGVIKKIVVDFCKNENNQSIMKRAWVVIPETLAKAIKKQKKSKASDSKSE